MFVWPGIARLPLKWSLCWSEVTTFPLSFCSATLIFNVTQFATCRWANTSRSQDLPEIIIIRVMIGLAALSMSFIQPLLQAPQTTFICLSIAASGISRLETSFGLTSPGETVYLSSFRPTLAAFLIRGSDQEDQTCSFVNEPDPQNMQVRLFVMRTAKGARRARKFPSIRFGRDSGEKQHRTFGSWFRTCNAACSELRRPGSRNSRVGAQKTGFPLRRERVWFCRWATKGHSARHRALRSRRSGACVSDGAGSAGPPRCTGSNMAIKLNEVQVALISAAAQRDDRHISLPDGRGKAAARKAASALLASGMAREVRAQGEAPVWRHDNDNQRAFALKLTALGAKAIEQTADDSNAEPQPKPRSEKQDAPKQEGHAPFAMTKRLRGTSRPRPSSRPAPEPRLTRSSRC